MPNRGCRYHCNSLSGCWSIVVAFFAVFSRFFLTTSVINQQTVFNGLQRLLLKGFLGMMLAVSWGESPVIQKY